MNNKSIRKIFKIVTVLVLTISLSACSSAKIQDVKASEKMPEGKSAPIKVTEMFDDTEFLTVKPEKSDEILKNPGKGWILYTTGVEAPFLLHNKEVLKYGSVGYTRYA